MTTGRATGSRWPGVMAALPRARFIPGVVYTLVRDRAGGDLVPVDRDRDPEGWARLVDTDDAVITQVDDGHPLPDGSGRESTSSASQPSVVLGMLTSLDAQPGETVLEIGTGTGWNAGLLASAVGAENVTTVEVDDQLAEQARANLAALGLGEVTVVTGDGTELAEGVYDRVIATVGVDTIPYRWVQRTAPGGRLVVPLINAYQPPGVAVLDRIGQRAIGGLADPCDFMAVRAQRIPRAWVSGFDETGPRTDTTTELHPYYWAGDRDASTAIGQRVPGVYRTWRATGEHTGRVWLYAPADRAVAAVTVEGDPPWPVEQTGTRQLFDEVQAAYQWWTEQGSPGVDTWQVAVTPAGQTITLKPGFTPAGKWGRASAPVS